jgi:hypothetical protein
VSCLSFVLPAMVTVPIGHLTVRCSRRIGAPSSGELGSFIGCAPPAAERWRSADVSEEEGEMPGDQR